MENKHVRYVLTVFQCGHLIQEIVKGSTNPSRLGVTKIDEPTVMCCTCRKSHYSDCSHPKKDWGGIKR